MSAILTCNDAQRRTLIDASVGRIKRMIHRRNELQKAIDKEIHHRNQLLDGYGDAAMAEAAEACLRDAEASMVSAEDLDGERWDGQS